ncbi:MAG TPA: DUF1080 domain-containing protein [Bryobacteraceae bacterium]|nr:DUF1080 domain-containing protein [Bryobacteraceae bacterium]
MIRIAVRSSLIAFVAIAGLNAADVPAHRPTTPLFNGKDLSNFDIFLRSKGLNNDPEHVFTVENGVIHVSGKEFGYFITRDEYADYYLSAEFKWGEGTYAPREGHARDSGILYHIVGDQKVWPTSIELQIQEGATGDVWLTDGASLRSKTGEKKTGPAGKAVPIDRFGKGPWKDVTGYRDPAGDIEKPHGEWNTVELVVQGDHIWQFVNGKLMNEGSEAYPSRGKILFQSEGAEIYFRNIRMAPLETATHSR